MQVSPSGPVLAIQGCHVNLSEERINYPPPPVSRLNKKPLPKVNVLKESFVCSLVVLRIFLLPLEHRVAWDSLCSGSRITHDEPHKPHPKPHCTPFSNTQVSKPSPKSNKREVLLLFIDETTKSRGKERGCRGAQDIHNCPLPSFSRWSCSGVVLLRADNGDFILCLSSHTNSMKPRSSVDLWDLEPQMAS